MKKPTYLSLLTVAAALLVWAFSTNGKEGLLLFFIGATLLLSTLAVGSVRHCSSVNKANHTPRTNIPAIAGAVLGLLLGGLVGAFSGFGKKMIAVFNPDLPHQDFEISFGAIGGGILGAFLIALLGGILQKPSVEDKNSTPDEDDKTQTSCEEKP